MIHPVGVLRLKQKRNRNKKSVSVRVNIRKVPGCSFVEICIGYYVARSVLCIFVFHAIVLNIFSQISLKSVLVYKVYEGSCIGLCQTRFIPNSINQVIAYRLPSSRQKFIHYEVWSDLLNQNIQAAHEGHY